MVDAAGLERMMAGRSPLGDDPALQSIIAFLTRIGIPVRETVLADATTLPGMAVSGGTLFYDPAARGWVSDLLHEAGHIAVSPPEVRTALVEIEDDPTEEAATLAWSYAAACAVGMPVETLFHAAYKSNPAGLILSFSMGVYIGLPMLQSWRMAARPGDGGAPYPAMLAWLRPPGIALGAADRDS